MLELTERQLAQLEALQKERYVDDVHASLVEARPELAGDTGLRQRLGWAYRYCVDTGFTDGAAITQFLHVEAAAPGFYRQPIVDRWLTKPQASPEERWADLMDATDFAMGGQ